MRVVPVGGEGGLDATLDRLFEALSACAALNPDADADDDSDDDVEVGAAEAEGEGGYDEEAATALDPLAIEQLLDTSSLDPAQLAMLQRYDAMLDASGGVPAFADEADGRFDDAEDEEEDK